MFCVSSDVNSGKKEFFIFSGGGCSCVRPDLDSGKNFNFGGGGCFVPNPRTGVF